MKSQGKPILIRTKSTQEPVDRKIFPNIQPGTIIFTSRSLSETVKKINTPPNTVD